MTIEELLKVVKDYNPEEVDIIRKAYEYANEMHRGQYRQSGEPYIIHPLWVAYILSEMHADRDTVCAGLLHDTLEDTSATKEDIAYLFNQNVANLVDGVTKLSKMNFSSKEEENYANTRKIITSIINDVRIIIIKLADRLHNMRTLEYKTPFKQKENALETMEIYVPIAYNIGAYRIKSELEDLSLRYLKPDMYKQIEEKKQKIELESQDCLNEMLTKIKRMLDDKNIPNEIKVRTKNIFGIYKNITKGNKISDIHDLLALKIMVDEVENCYQALYLVHKEYHPIHSLFKDYISLPKPNLYQSLHTTVFGPDSRLVQIQMRTFEMDQIDSFGFTTYWDKAQGDARYIMQKDLKEKCQFLIPITEMNAMFSDNREFVNQVKSEIFADKIYVYTPKGDIIELPKGATPVDFAYKIHTDIGNTMVAAVVNNKYVPISYLLQNNDRIKIITDELSYGSREDWLDIAKTSYAKKKIKEFNKNYKE